MWKSISEILMQNVLGNTIESYLVFAGIILLGIIFKRLLAKAISYLFFKVFKKQAKEIGIKQFYSLTRKPLGYFLLLIFIFIACEQLAFPEEWHLVPVDQFGVRLVIISTYEILLLSTLIWLGLKIIDFIGMIFLARALKDDNKMNDQLIPFAVDILKIIVIILGTFIILGTVFNLNIGSLIAGLGIGGLAVALAAKETLENLFGSFTIFLDKPFVIGDLVKIGEVTGTVEKIGFRSTRIRTFEKSYVTIPNKKMIDAELDNLTMRTAMRERFLFSLDYGTPVDVIKKIMSDIEACLKKHDHLTEDSFVKLAEFGESSLKILVLYFVETTDWSFYMSVKEEISFCIIKIVHGNGAHFAFPATSVHLKGSNKT
jgi:MscS family membrane protein